MRAAFRLLLALVFAGLLRGDPAPSANQPAAPQLDALPSQGLDVPCGFDSDDSWQEDDGSDEYSDQEWDDCFGEDESSEEDAYLPSKVSVYGDVSDDVVSALNAKVHQDAELRAHANDFIAYVYGEMWDTLPAIVRALKPLATVLAANAIKVFPGGPAQLSIEAAITGPLNAWLRNTDGLSPALYALAKAGHIILAVGGKILSAAELTPQHVIQLHDSLSARERLDVVRWGRRAYLVHMWVHALLPAAMMPRGIPSPEVRCADRPFTWFRVCGKHVCLGRWFCATGQYPVGA